MHQNKVNQLNVFLVFFFFLIPFIIFSEHVLVLCVRPHNQSREQRTKPQTQISTKPISPAIKSINLSNQQSTTTKSSLPKSSKISQQPVKP